MVVPLCCVCFVSVLWKRALLGRFLGTPGGNGPPMLVSRPVSQCESVGVRVSQCVLCESFVSQSESE